MQQRAFALGSGMYWRLSETISRRLAQKRRGSTGDSHSSTSLSTVPSSGATLLLFFLLLLVGAFASACWINAPMMRSSAATAHDLIPSSAVAHHVPKSQGPLNPHPILEPKPKPLPWPPLACHVGNQSAHRTCPTRPPAPSRRTPPEPGAAEPSASCPAYFRWIHEDLRPWKATGITREMVERARSTANFRLVVVGGRAYVERFRRSFQTRDVFTIWGLLQLLRRYPGRVPDLELMFDCVDWPVVRKAAYRGGKNASAPPPLFRYCGDDATLDIVFPDWSFWGWPEINIKPWERLLKDLKEGNERVMWMDREPYAYWKGNPSVAATRQDLLRCNVSDTQDWNARVYAQDWLSESRQGFKQSDLASQCRHRYKIYIEGSAWSVSEKYILACDSLTLLVTPRYYDFFTRGLMPVHHYWPVRSEDKCRSIKYAVDWGNSHKQKAQAIGRETSRFIQEQLRMDDVYDYMFHLLNEYAKLLRFKPAKPRKAIEYCAESMACPARGVEEKFMMDSMVKTPHDTEPCTLPPPFDPPEIELLTRRKANSIKQIELWEKKALEDHKTKL